NSDPPTSQIALLASADGSRVVPSTRAGSRCRARRPPGKPSFRPPPLYFAGRRANSAAPRFFFSSRRRHTRWPRDWSFRRVLFRSLEQVVQGVAVGNADYVLLDDGAVVENVGYVVTCSSDQLDATGECLVIGFGAHERRQKRVMDIDDAVRVFIDELVGQDLHVARQDNEIRIVLF